MMQLKELLGTGEVKEVSGNMEASVTGLSYDSRKVEKGHVFFAVPGAHHDGHEFAREALDRGAAAVVVERKLSLPSGATWVRVPNVRSTMGPWADLFFGRPSRSIVLFGVTGTNGKTTVTYLLESIFSAAGLPSGVIGTINYRYRDKVFPAPHTTPESIDLQRLLAEMVKAGVKSAVMEVSSHALALERVRGMAFDGALFTNLSRDHLDFHANMDDYFFSKSRLFTEHLPGSAKKKKIALIHGGDPKGAELLRNARDAGIDVLSYGQGESWDIHPHQVRSDLAGLRGALQVKNQRLDFSSSLIGAANLENIMGAAGAAFGLGIPLEAIGSGIERLKAVPGRLEKIQNVLDITLLVDYAHTPDALERVLSSLKPLCRGRLIVLFGCGGDRDRGKRPLMGEIAARLGDLVVLTSDNPRSEEPLKIVEEIEAGVQETGIKKFQISDLRSQISNLKSEIFNLKSYVVEPDRRAAIRLALRLARGGDLVLIAGKGHEDYQILGPKRIHFDDREVAREELEKLTAEC